jgi:hypothetical protein
MLAAPARHPSEMRRTAGPNSAAAHAVWNATATYAARNAATTTEAVRNATAPATDTVGDATTATPEAVWGSASTASTASTPKAVPATSLRISGGGENGSQSNDAQDLDV